MSVSPFVKDEVRRLGECHGRDLGAALLLASKGETIGRSLKQRMSQVVLDQIGAMVGKLQRESFPPELTDIFERSARQGVRERIMESAGSVERSAA
jgi:hypothetical protein